MAHYTVELSLVVDTDQLRATLVDDGWTQADVDAMGDEALVMRVHAGAARELAAHVARPTLRVRRLEEAPAAPRTTRELRWPTAPYT